MKTQYSPLEIASYLTEEETIAEFLTAAAEDENPDVLLRALAEVAKARGMAQVARDAGLGRESLYKALAPGSHPRFETINAILHAVGVSIAVRAPASFTLTQAQLSFEAIDARALAQGVVTEAKKLPVKKRGRRVVVHPASEEQGRRVVEHPATEERRRLGEAPAPPRRRGSRPTV